MVDLSLPDIAGVEFFDQLFAAMPNIPIIIVASVKDEKIAKLAVQRGARDYFPTHCIDKLFFRRQSPPSSLMRPRSKNFFTKKERAQIMLNSIGDAVISTNLAGAVIVFHDVSSARAVTQNLACLAQHDSLTDLPIRVFLNDRLSQAILLPQRHQMALAVLYLDPDRFKHINDSLGHLVGDHLLQSVALRLSKCVRASDTVSRQGGDEFVILVPKIAQGQDTVCDR